MLLAARPPVDRDGARLQAGCQLTDTEMEAGFTDLPDPFAFSLTL